MPPNAHASQPPILGPGASRIDFSRVMRFPEPGWQVPRLVAYSPNGALITYLQSEEGTDKMALFAFDVAQKTTRLLVRGEDLAREGRALSREEELRRERQRQRTAGITDVRWARRAPVMLVPYGGNIFLVNPSSTPAVTRLTDAAGPDIDPKINDDGTAVAFVRSGELHLLDVKTKAVTALTSGAPAGVTRGVSDFVAQEEFDEPSGHFWSPRGDKIVFLEVDERGVETVPVLGYRGGKPDLMQQPYPLAGKQNPKVRALIVDLATRAITPITLPKGLGERYLGRFGFLPDGKSIVFQALSRDQHHLSVLRADSTTGEARELWSETSSAWTRFVEVRPLERAQRLLVTGEQGGHIHLAVRDASTGAKVSDLTSGDWDVDHIVAAEEHLGRALFVGNKTSTIERRLYAVPLAGGEITTLTPERGVHNVRLAPNGQGFVDEHSAADRPPRTVVMSAVGPGGAVIADLPVPRDKDFDDLGLRVPELVTVKSPGGPTLHGALLKPRHMEEGKRYPTIVMVYGGPGVQTVLDAWAPRLLWQHLADRGFVVFQLDNRGSAGRGPAFEAPIYLRAGEVELEDQLAGASMLASLPFVDPSRIGIYGHSYGGFMAALAMLKAPGRFKVGVAGSPVTSWAFYDTGYTERHMGTPATNPKGYAESDLAGYAKNLQGKLFLIHAMMDENVHFENTAHLIDALVAADKDFDLLVFPGERHGYRDPAAKRHAMRRVVEYFAQHL